MELAEWSGGRFVHCKLLFPLSEQLVSFDLCYLEATSEFGLVFELDTGEPSISLSAAASVTASVIIIPELLFFHLKRFNTCLYHSTVPFCLQSALKMDPGEIYYLNDFRVTV